MNDLSPQQRAAITRKANAEARKSEEIVNSQRDTPIIESKKDATNEMNDLARRIFDGQSPDLPKKIRVDRIVMRLKAKGYTDMEKLDLPLQDYKRYL